MAQNITLMGASYSAVPAVRLPKTGGGTADFTDVSDTTAAAGDVAQGKYFYTSNGTKTQGTASGGGGGLGTLLGTYNIGAISTSSTSATSTGKSMTVSGCNGYNLLIIVCRTDSVVNSRHYMTVRTVLLNGSSNAGTINGTTIATATQHFKASSSGVLSSRGGTTPYGVYPNSCSVGSGTATIEFYQRYNSTSTGTLNGNYTAYVYGVKLTP